MKQLFEFQLGQWLMSDNTKSGFLPLKNGMVIVPVPWLLYRRNEQMLMELNTVAITF